MGIKDALNRGIMVRLFSGKSANDVWLKSMNALLQTDAFIDGRICETKEILHSIFSLQNPKERFITSRYPPISIAFALAEVIWILSGSNESKILNFWNPKLPEFSGYGKKYHGAYGYRIKKNFKIDQLERAYYSLKNNPTNRQTVILLWDPMKDLPTKKGKPKDKDIPCNICSMLKIRNKKLEWTQIMRSNDAYIGFPYNVIQFTTIQEILSGWLDLKVGTYSHFSDSLHIYRKDIAKFKIVRKTPVLNSDNIAIEKQKSKYLIKQIFTNMKKIVNSKNISQDDLQKFSTLNSSEEGYNNIMLIIGIYAAEKFKHQALIPTLLNKCSNKLLINMWEAWVSSKTKVKRSSKCQKKKKR